MCPDVSGFIGHLQVYLATLFEVLVRVLVHGVSVQLSIILVAGAVALIAISLVQLDHVVILVGEVNETVRGIIGLRPRIANITCTGVLVIAAGIPHLHVIGTKFPGRRPWARVFSSALVIDAEKQFETMRNEASRDVHTIKSIRACSKAPPMFTTCR